MAISPIIKCLALDIGGVLADIDRDPMHALLLQNHKTLSQFFDGDFWSLQKGATTPHDFFHKKSIYLRIDNRALRLAFLQMFKPSPQVKLLTRLKIPYFFLSNINELHFCKFLSTADQYGLATISSILSYRVGCLKPDPQFFLLSSIIRRDPHSILYIDDSLENLKTAKRLGMPVAHCRSPKALASILDFLI